MALNGSLTLSILYRGPLSSCNYACPYCPFAKRVDSRETLRKDYEALERFVAWVESRREDRISVFFTPWGEALIRRPYREAMRRLSHMPNVTRVAIQTNLSCSVGWIEECDLNAVAFWCTYHPGEVRQKDFLSKCYALDAMGARYSVGVVGLEEHFEEIEFLKEALRPSVYLWINAYKRLPNYYDEASIERLVAIDPLFELNLRRHPSRGKPCHAGETAITVDGDGVMRRCHFIAEPIGNIYDSNFEAALRPRSCVNETCGCHIGYAHRPDLDLAELFGEGLLERIPSGRPTRADAQKRLKACG